LQKCASKRKKNVVFLLEYIRDIRKVTLSSHFFGPPFTLPNPSFSGNTKVRKFDQISVRNDESNAQASRAIIVAVQVGAMKIYVAAAEALRKKRKTDGETQETIKN